MSNITLNIPELGEKYFDYRKDCWGNSYTWDFERNLNQVVKLAIHHSVTKPEGKTGRQQVDEIGAIHQTRGYGGFGYHFVIDTEGKVWYVGDIGTGRANITANNEKIIGICLIGDFTKHLPTASQIHSTHLLCKFFLFNYPALVNISKWEDVMGHRDAVEVYQWPGATSTACPGTNWKVSGDNLYNRIVNDIWQGYPAPTPIPLPTPPPTPPIPPLPPIPPIPPPLPPYPDLRPLVAQLRTVVYDRWTWIGSKGWKNRLAQLKEILK